MILNVFKVTSWIMLPTLPGFGAVQQFFLAIYSIPIPVGPSARRIQTSLHPIAGINADCAPSIMPLHLQHAMAFVSPGLMH